MSVLMMPTLLPTSSVAHTLCNVQGCYRFAKCQGSCLIHATALSLYGGPKSPAHSASSSPRSTTSSSNSSSKNRRCFIEHCVKFARIGGLCTQHNMQLSNQRRKCSVEECSSYARTAGLCIRHGGGKLCSVEGCTTVQQSGGLCRAHGGGSKCKPCKVAGCTHFARVGGLCGQHKKQKTLHEESVAVLISVLRSA
ncbi:hypothetical protein AC1031_018865 [Aphanomyces cochlioides]|nr:hypothetical protein AC1031_018865 [Aphanomyces cochlioides]